MTVTQKVYPLEYAAKIAYSSKEVLHFTYEKAKEYADKPGVYCECGVAAGAQIIAMAAGAPNKTIYAFDSFEGIPLPSNKDNQMPGIRFLTKAEQEALPDPGKQLLETSRATIVSLDDFTNHLENAIGIDQGIGGDSIRQCILSNGANVIAIQGWFENTIPDFVDKRNSGEWCDAKFVNDFGGPYRVEKFQIAILRLDGDLYNSTYVCLKYLYPKVIKDGLVIVDDWALPGCRQAVIDHSVELGISIHDIQLITDKNSAVAYWTK